MAEDLTQFAIQGMSMHLAGMEYMLAQMQTMVAEFRARLEAGGQPRKPGRPTKRAQDLLNFMGRAGLIAGRFPVSTKGLKRGTDDYRVVDCSQQARAAGITEEAELRLG